MSWIGRLLRSKKKGGSTGGNILRFLGDSLTRGTYSKYISPVPTQNIGIYAGSYTTAQTFGIDPHARIDLNYTIPINEFLPTEDIDMSPAPPTETEGGSFLDDLGAVLGSAAEVLIGGGVLDDSLIDLLDLQGNGEEVPQEIQDAFGVDSQGNEIVTTLPNTTTVTPDNIEQIAQDNAVAQPSDPGVTETKTNMQKIKDFFLKAWGFIESKWMFILIPLVVIIPLYFVYKRYFSKNKKKTSKKGVV